jgi:hypothetical protein
MKADADAMRSAHFPDEYGQPGNPNELLPWSFVLERLVSAPNYWIATTTPDGHPHTRPIDGVWVDGAVCFGGSPETRWVRNLLANPRLSIHLASTTEVVILEGTGELITDANDPLAEPSAKATREKYPQYFSGETPFRPFWVMRPRIIYAWTLAGFPHDATRWTLLPLGERLS